MRLRSLTFGCLLAACSTTNGGAAPAPTTAPQATPPPVVEPCTPAWYEAVEREVHVGDGQGHGPDLGSAEWMSVVEKRLGLYQQPDVPEAGTPEWCARVDEALGFGAAEYARR